MDLFRAGPGEVRARRNFTVTHRGRDQKRVGHQVEVVLWANKAALLAAIGRPPDHNMGACFMNATWHEYRDDATGELTLQRMQRRVGRIHLVAGAWNERYVAHEVFHCVKHVYTILHVNEQGDNAFGPGCVSLWRAAELEWKGPLFDHEDAEEELAYPQGDLTAAIYAWLWAIDAHGEHAVSLGTPPIPLETHAP
jgi:hypothetical protein